MAIWSPAIIGVFPAWSQADDALAPVLAAIEARECVGTGVDAFQHIFLIDKLPAAHPIGKPRYAVLIAIHLLEDDEALHAGALDGEVALEARPLRLGGPTLDPDGAPHPDPRAHGN